MTFEVTSSFTTGLKMMLRTVVTIVAFCCACWGDTKKIRDLFDENDLQHYVRGNHEIEDFDIIDPIASGGRSKRSSVSESILLTSRLKISMFDEDFHLELVENPWLVPNNLKVEHMYGNRVEEELYNGHRCHFHGRSMSHNDSVAVISSCTGVHGVINYEGNEVYIEPLKKDHKLRLAPFKKNGLKQPHIVYKRRLKEEGKSGCGVKKDFSNGKGRIKKSIEDIDFEFYVGPKFMEIKLVLDHSFVSAHSPDASEYALALMNVASRRFLDSSLGFPIHLYITSIVELHYLEPFVIYPVLYYTLISFELWVKETGINNDADPKHWDHAILLTGHDLDVEQDPSIGYGTRLPMCFPHPNRTSCNVVLDLGLGSGFVIAHEIGHSLGLEHDDADGVGCGSDYIMASKQNEHQSSFTWSNCSRECLNKIWRGKAGCLDDIPDDKVKEVSIFDFYRNPPTLDQQCLHVIWTLLPGYLQYVFNCEYKTTCTSLYCKASGSLFNDESECIALGMPPAEGTTCGSNHYCINGECIHNVEDVSSLLSSDGNFSSWESSPCSRSCGGGIKVTRRTCSSPPNAFAGAFCDGQHLHYELCNMQPCGDLKSFLEKRNDSCADIDPQLGFRILTGDQVPTSCLKGCWNYTSSTWDYHESIYFEDGTKCWNDVFKDDFTVEKRCIAGKCVQFNCYGDEGDQGVYDTCGVCGGNGTSCTLHKETIYNDEEQYQDLLLPVRATSIVVVNHDCRTERGRTALDVQSGDPVFAVQGNIFRVGFDFAYGDKCAVNLKSAGPLTSEFRLPLQKTFETPSNLKLFSVSYFLPTSSTIYLWRPGPFGICSVDCGNGMRQRIVICMEVINGQENQVSQNLCDALSKPSNSIPCSIPCWSLKLSECKTDVKGYHYTKVRSGECKIGEEVVDSSECNQATKPVNIYTPCSDKFKWIKYQWTAGPWSGCYNCEQTRVVTCTAGPHKFPVSKTLCTSEELLETFQTCHTTECSRKPSTPPMDLALDFDLDLDTSRVNPNIAVWVGVATLVFCVLSKALYYSMKQKRRRRRVRDESTAEGFENVELLPTASHGGTNTVPAFSDLNGTLLQTRPTDLPKCFLKENFQPEDTLADEFTRLLPQTPGMVAQPSNENNREIGRELTQANTATQSHNSSPSCIKDQKGNVAFIVTEGSNPSSLERLWKLMWLEKVAIIVNLTERNDSSTPHGPLPTSSQGSYCVEFNFKSFRTTERPEYSIKELKVAKGSETRHVIICHFYLWPKTGIPAQPESLIGFIKKLKSLYQGHSSPLLIYCNDDLGKGAAFLTIFSLVDVLKTKQRINVQDFMENLIMNHNRMVPNQSQCNFVHEALSAASMFPLVDVQPHILLSQGLNEHKRRQKTISEYEALPHHQKFGTLAKSEEGCKPNNVAKNRYPNIMPLDPYRPVWKCTDEEDTMNYINATLIDSFWSKDGIILTQSPLPNTIEDFWSMIHSYSCVAVVSLNNFTIDTKVPRYWHNGSTAKYGKITVESSRIQLVIRGTAFAKRKMRIRRESVNTPLIVDHYEFQAWPTSINNLSGILDIIGVIQPLLRAKKPIVLHCLDGVSRCGIIAAVSTELGRVKEDGVVDLFQTVCKLRRRNPTFIKSQEEYNSCYMILQAALKAWRSEF